MRPSAFRVTISDLSGCLSTYRFSDIARKDSVTDNVSEDTAIAFIAF
jgi:hypothetical protein